MRIFKPIKTFLFTALFAASCKEPFDPKLKPQQSNYLVVEGFINAAGSTNITLSRTVPLTETSQTKPETNAQVKIEGENNAVYNVNETEPGTYVSDSYNLDKDQKYRLHITTGGQDYLSDFVSVKVTPPIDSISWKADNGAVRIYVNTHDLLNKTTYYKWEYEETWEIHSPYESDYVYSNGMVTLRDLAEIPKVFYCWQFGRSTSILTGSSVQLQNDVISQQPILFIPRASIKTSVRYSILLKQYALDRQAYDFYEQMKKNTESLGSIFDPLPSDLTGNIVCVTNPNERVIGIVTALTPEQKRIFISKDDIGGSLFKDDCESVLVANNKDSFAEFFDGRGLLPYQAHKTGFAIDHYFSAAAYCVDCRLRGSNVKPSFW